MKYKLYTEDSEFSKKTETKRAQIRIVFLYEHIYSFEGHVFSDLNLRFISCGRIYEYPDLVKNKQKYTNVR